MKALSDRPRQILSFLSIVILVAGVVAAAYFCLPFLPEERPSIQNGVIDLRDMDLERTVAILPTQWEYYPGGLYSPEQIAAGEAGEARVFHPEDEQIQKIGTYRAVIRVNTDQMLGMNAYSLDYATHIFVDGKAVLDVGTVSKEAYGFEPRIQNYVLPVAPKGSLDEGDTLTGSLKADGAGVGKHLILQDTPLANPNYDVTFQPGTLTVTEIASDPVHPGSNPSAADGNSPPTGDDSRV